MLASPASGQIWERERVSFEGIDARARALAAQPYAAPNKDALPGWMKNLSYDQYRDIRFVPERALWGSENLPFRAQLFHPGYLFREPVTINEYTSTHQQKIRLAEAFFQYGPLVGQRGELTPEAGFAGFRLHAPLNRADCFDELVVFQGASYWRALGKNQRYGISSRGIAVDTGSDGIAEEFPLFREFWLSKPGPGDPSTRLFALLDGPSYTGAYGFEIQPGDDTTVTVHAVLYARRAVTRLGIAPMSSMFWFGENSRRRFDDFRPEVHDSDGLAIRMGSGERIWRPITNDSGRLEFSAFSMDRCAGFGLLQRDRRFSAYEDGEAAYHLRPSLWIEPTSNWGSGKVVLMEIPTTNELSDNTVALWEPSHTPQPGERIELSYKQHWTMEEDPSQAGGRVVATRTGLHDWQPEQRTMTVEFAGGRLENWQGEPPEAVISALGDASSKIKIQGRTVQALPDGRWRVAFQIAPALEGGKLADAGPQELRCCLKKGEDFLTETWAYRITP
ncbi:MAG: glucans biosynthesis protein [Verrucomicrobia bacterium]|nr:MAG: glucans biosynthesis protein [Verrucomicrobiota bacterium]TAE87256.1 MAG: glucans biosynthesis protein [Verrucomicrobiota bacterium]TAF25091.1 MAG: glucans biosynthesis protein [Verrucomicrobiota bacterium]